MNAETGPETKFNGRLALLLAMAMFVLVFDTSLMNVSISAVVADSADAVIVDTIIVMAHTLGMTVVGEGVETAEQEAYLRERGCDLVQGYYFGRPLVANKFAALLRRRKLGRVGPGYVAALH